MVEEERPLILNLIIIYILAFLAYAFISMIAGYGGIVGLGSILMLLGLYYGLWKMQKDWMHIVVFLLVISTLLQLYVAYVFLIFAAEIPYFELIAGLIEFGVIILLNALSIGWLLSNSKLFHEKPKKKDEKPKGKYSFFRRGEFVMGIIMLILLLLLIVSLYLM